MSLIDIRMDSTSLSIDGYEIGPRVSHGTTRVCPISVWDEVRAVLDGFDIDQPLRDKERIAQLQRELDDMTVLTHSPDV